jgi:hypothetical protein
VSVACVTLTGPSRAQHKAAVREPNCCTIFGGSPYSIFSPWREIEFSSLSMQICPSRGSPQPQQGLDRLPPQAPEAGPNPGRAHLPLMHKSSRQVTGAPGEWPVPQAGLTSTCSVPPRRVGLDPPQKRQDPAPSSKPWLSCLSHRVSHQQHCPGQGEAQEEGHPTFSARCVPHLTHHPVCRCLRPQLWSVALEQHQIVHHAPLCLPFALATIQV